MIAVWVGLLGILIGTATDIHHREVPDWVNYGMIAAGLGLAVLHAIDLVSLRPLLGSLLGLAAGWALGAAMYYTGQWGGGDAKMMMGLGALIGLPISLSGWLPAPFFAVFLLFSVFAGAAYGLAWMTVLTLKHRSAVADKLTERIHKPGMLRIRMVVISLAILLAVAGIIMRGPFMILLLTLAAITYLTFYLSLGAKAVEEACFVEQRSVEDLVEGDWIVEIPSQNGREVELESPGTGITKEQIDALKDVGVPTVIVKEGIPFVPSFLIAYLAALWWSAQNLPLLFWL